MFNTRCLDHHYRACMRCAPRIPIFPLIGTTCNQHSLAKSFCHPSLGHRVLNFGATSPRSPHCRTGHMCTPTRAIGPGSSRRLVPCMSRLSLIDFSACKKPSTCRMPTCRKVLSRPGAAQAATRSPGGFGVRSVHPVELRLVHGKVAGPWPFTRVHAL